MRGEVDFFGHIVKILSQNLMEIYLHLLESQKKTFGITFCGHDVYR